MKEKELVKIVSAAIAISTVGIIISYIVPKKDVASIKLPGKKPVRISFRGHDNTATDDDEVEVEEI